MACRDTSYRPDSLLLREHRDYSLRSLGFHAYNLSFLLRRVFGRNLSLQFPYSFRDILEPIFEVMNVGPEILFVSHNPGFLTAVPSPCVKPERLLFQVVRMEHTSFSEI